MKAAICLSLTIDIVRELDEFAKKSGMTRSKAVEVLLSKALEVTEPDEKTRYYRTRIPASLWNAIHQLGDVDGVIRKLFGRDTVREMNTLITTLELVPGQAEIRIRNWLEEARVARENRPYPYRAPSEDKTLAQSEDKTMDKGREGAEARASWMISFDPPTSTKKGSP